jgi:hypothetical protein
MLGHVPASSLNPVPSPLHPTSEGQAFIVERTLCQSRKDSVFHTTFRNPNGWGRLFTGHLGFEQRALIQVSVVRQH